MGNPYSPASHMTGHAASKAAKSAAQLIGLLIPNVLTSDTLILAPYNYWYKM